MATNHRSLADLPEGVTVADLIPASALPDHLPKRANGKKIHRSRVYAWFEDGLPYTVVNRQRHTCIPWLDEWERRRATAPSAPAVRRGIQCNRNNARAQLAAPGGAAGDLIAEVVGELEGA